MRASDGARPSSRLETHGDAAFRSRALSRLFVVLVLALVLAPPTSVAGATHPTTGKRLTVHGMSRGTHVDVAHQPRFAGGQGRRGRPMLRRDRGEATRVRSGTSKGATSPATSTRAAGAPPAVAAPNTSSLEPRFAAPKAAIGAQITPTSILVLDSDSGDYVGQGLYQTFPSSSSAITTSTFGGATKAAPNEIQVNFAPDPPSPAWWWNTDFAAPPGQALAVGSYTSAVRTVSRTPGQPGLDIFGDGRGCNALTGSFTIEDLTVDATGTLASFAASFVQHCEGGAPVLSGEVRFNSTVGWAEKRLSPTSHDFGTVAVGGAPSSQTVIVTSIGTSPLVIAKSSFTTVPSPSSFIVTGGTCVSGSVDITIAPTASCTFTVATDTSKVLTPRATVRFLDNTARGAGDLPVTTSFTGAATVALSMTSPVTSEGGGTVTSSPTGVDCTRASGYVPAITGVCSSLFVPGKTVTLTATGDSNSVFTGWTGVSCPGTGTCSFSPAAGTTTVTAKFETALVTVGFVGAGSGIVTSSSAGLSCLGPSSGGTCTLIAQPGSTVILTATPDSNTIFKGWSGVTCPGTGTCSVTPSVGTTSVTVDFETALVSLSTLGNGVGGVGSSPSGLFCSAPGSTGICVAGFLPGSTVALTATPSTGSVFAGWGGACSGTGTCTLKPATGTTNVTADFETAKVQISASGTGVGVLISAPAGINCRYSNGVCNGSPGGDFPPGATMTIMATPAAGSIFAGWGGPCSGTGACVLKPSAGLTIVTARFEIAGPRVGALTGTPSIQPGISFAGVSDPIGAECTPAPCLEPPDPWVAVGPNDIVQATNASIRISSRSGTLRQEVSLPSFFAEPAGETFDGDPRVLWDPLHARWLAVEMSGDCSVGNLHLAVSDTIDPSGGWTVYSWSASGAIMDYPGLGVSSDKVAVSVNRFGSSPCATGTYQGADVIVVDAATLVAEPAELPWAHSGVDPNLFTWRPAEGLSAGADLPLVVGVVAGPALHVGFARLTGTLAAGNLDLSAITDLTTSARIPPFTDPPVPAAFKNPPQNPIDGRPLDAIAENGMLWVVSGSGCVPSGDTQARSCVRLTQVRISATPTVLQDFTVGQSSQDVFEGGIGLTRSGTLAVVWSQSSATARGAISTFASYRLTTDPIDSLRSPRLISAGEGTYAGQRWGDYVGVAQDPLDPRSVWEANEVSTASGDWATQIAQLTQPESAVPSGSTYHALAPTRLLDTRTGNGLSGTFASHIARTFQVTGRGGVPRGATAVTGNLTVTQQTTGGYLFIGPVAMNNPTSSTLNFPVRDNRANGLTVALSRLGTLSITSTAAKTHVIFDVTGYFQ